MEETGTYTTHPTAFVNQPFAAPHQAFFPIGSEVPIGKKSSFPPGEAKNRNRKLVPFNGQLNFPTLRADTIRPYSWRVQNSCLDYTIISPKSKAKVKKSPCRLGQRENFY